MLRRFFTGPLLLAATVLPAVFTSPVALLAVPTTVQEAESDPSLAEVAPLRVYLITMDQGDEVWERFGHNALMVRNEATGEEVAWNWGLFDFADVDFIPRFLRGTMLYTMGGMDPSRMVESYAAGNRSVYINEVRLDPEQAADLEAFVRWNAREENRDYVYDYFRDNCSTRIRDVLDLALGGHLQELFHDRLTDRSWRWHARRLVRETLWIDQGLSFLLGSRGDRPITEWEAMFVPMILMELLEEVEIPDAGGGSRALLGPRQTLFEADREPTPAGPPPLSPGFPLSGMAGAAGLLFLGWSIAGAIPFRRAGGRSSDAIGPPGSDPPNAPAARRTGTSVAPRIAFVVLALAWTIFTGLLGLLLVSAWFTDHVFIHWNVNLFYFSPAAPLVGGLLVVAFLRRGGRKGWPGRWAALIATLIAAGSLLAVGLQVFGIVTQGNSEVVALGLPINLALALALTRIHLSSGAPSPSPTGVTRKAETG